MATKPEPAHEAVLVALQQARAARKDERDLPRTMSQREIDDYAETTRLLDRHALGIRSTLEMISSRTARCEPLVAAIERLRAVDAKLDAEILATADWRPTGDKRERDRERGRQQDLAASKIALHRGVDYYNGVPALPTALRRLLTDPPCPTCGHVPEVVWLGPIEEIEQQIGALTKTLAEHEARLNRHIQGVQALLAKDVNELTGAR